MRIFAVFFHPGSVFTAVGGAEKRFLRVLSIWEKKDITVKVVESYPKIVTTCRSNVVTVEVAPPISATGKNLYFTYLEWILWTAKACFLCPSIVKKEIPDVIIATNNTLPSLLVAYFVHILSKRPLAVTTHHFDFPDLYTTANVASSYRVYRMADFEPIAACIKALTFSAMLSLIKRSNLCIAVSNSTRQFLLANGVSPHRVRVSGNGIDNEPAKGFGCKAKYFDGVFVGRISKEKGIFDLVDIWKQVISTIPNARLAIVGSGPDYLKLDKLVKNRGLASNIILKGKCSDLEMHAVLNRSKIFLFPSLFEGWGLAVGEALASGLPVICYNVPALREVFGECQSVFFVPIKNKTKFARTIASVFSHKPSELKRNSVEFVKRFDWGEVALTDLKIIAETFHLNLAMLT